MFFDSHAHYDDEQYSSDRDSVLLSLKDEGVSNVINIGSSLESSMSSVFLAEKYDFIYAAVGVHPSETNGFEEKELDELRKMCANKKVVAIGEIGLDYYYNNTDKDTQMKAFKLQLELANELSLPVVIHDRDAHADCISILKAKNPFKTEGVMHCFSGSVEMAKIVLDMGMYIALGGPVTYKNARHSVEVAKYVPLDRLLIETDCPYLPPVPCRGERNSSAFLVHTAGKIAQIRGIALSEFARITSDNAKRLFKIS